VSESRNQDKRIETPDALSPPGGSAGRTIWSRTVGTMLAGLLLVWSGSWRKRMRGIERLDALAERKERTLVLFWHGKYPPLFPLLRGKRACILTNRSFRGMIIGHMCRRFGYQSVHLPEEPEKRYLVTLRRALANYVLWGTAADGPTGPWHQIKPSTLELAARLGFTLLPIGVAGGHCWRSSRRWDKIEMPVPFTRIGLVVGEPLRLPERIDRANVSEWVSRLRENLEKCHEEAERLV
jgi:lysophospholipid acyltransferase (LPLAT)-like uncharacterized protein